MREDRGRTCLSEKKFLSNGSKEVYKKGKMPPKGKYG